VDPRSAWFAQDFSESFMLDDVRNGVIVRPAGHVHEPFIDAEDIADLAVAALTQPGKGSCTRSPAQSCCGSPTQLPNWSAATGRRIGYQPISLADYLAEGWRQGVPDELLEVYIHLFAETLDGRNAWIADGIQCVTGAVPP
jgi:uncharacterized protein YbjT (DUF2867 family)